MKFRNYSPLLILGIFVFQIGNAQKITTNETGQKIVVFDDGSWRYAEDADLDSLTPKGTIDSIVEYPEQSDLDIAIRLAEEASVEESKAIREEEDVKYRRLLLEDDLKEALASEDYFDDEIQDIKNDIKEAKKLEKKAKARRKAASKRAKGTAKLLTMNSKDRTKALKKYIDTPEVKKSREIIAEEPVGIFPGEKIKEVESVTSEEALVASGNDSGPSIEYAEKSKSFAKYEASKDVVLNPPRSKCQLTFDGIDEFSGKKRKDVKKQLFFTYTNEELRSIFKDREYITCYGYLSSLSGGLKFLTLNITIASSSAQREYGIIEKGSQINIKLLDGENVKLVNTKTNMGTENPLESSVTYRAQYLISSGDEKKLKKSEVDKCRIIWSSGYEDYEVYELDFFLDQFKCLDKK